MSTSCVLLDAFGRTLELVTGVVDGLDGDALTYRVDPGANTIAWLVWHLSRIEDDHVAHAAVALGREEGTEQVWLRNGFAARFALPFEAADTGYGHGPDDVAAVRVGADHLSSYYRAVHEQTDAFVTGLSEEDYDVVVDRRWDPPVTLAVRLVSVLGDVTQHVGQAAFVRGVVERA